jgi:putative hydrolase of the HAD superfamily
MKTAPLPCRTVFFDVFGTLLLYGDMRAAWRDWMAALHGGLQELGLRADLPELAERCHGFFSRPAPAPRTRELTVFEDRVRRLMGEMDLAGEPADVRRVAAGALQAWMEYITPDPDAADVLAALSADHPLAVVSNFDHPPAVTRALRDAELLDFFGEVVVSGAVGAAKPAAAIFELALARTAETPHHTVHVGDSRDDLLGAAAAGLRCVLLARPGDADPAEHVDYDADAPGASAVQPADLPRPAARIESLRELPALLEVRF